MIRHPEGEAAPRNRVRIIGGRWRGRLLRFPELPGLRPTPDRVRETLFNWLGQRLDGLSCLDLFAGSGALGFEAASRGAARVVLVESQPAALAALRANARLLEGAPAQVLRADGLAYLASGTDRFDLIFLDPPYAAGLLPRALAGAATRLAPGGRIYAEFGAPPDLAGWRVLREGRAGQSRFALLESA